MRLGADAADIGLDVEEGPAAEAIPES